MRLNIPSKLPLSNRIECLPNSNLLEESNIYQSRYTSQFIDWFKKTIGQIQLIANFLQLEFDSSITEETLDKVISFASNHIKISTEDMHFIKHSQKLLLFYLEQAQKKNSSTFSDLTMCSYDAAELCELIGNFTQLVLQDIINKDTIG